MEDDEMCWLVFRGGAYRFSFFSSFSKGSPKTKAQIDLEYHIAEKYY